MQAPDVRLEPVRWADARFLYHLAGDPTARRFARDQRHPTPWGHWRWMARRVAQPWAWVVWLDGKRVGYCDRRPQVLADRGRDVAVVSINLAPAARGRGIGRQLIRDLATLPGLATQRVGAYIHCDNVTSRNAFRAAGFAFARSAGDPWEWWEWAPAPSTPARSDPYGPPLGNLTG